MNPIIEQGCYMQEVRTAVDPDIYYDERAENDGESLAEWIAVIADDVLAQKNKLLRLLCWLAAFRALPPTMTTTLLIADRARTTALRVTEDTCKVWKHPRMQDFEVGESPEIQAMLRMIGEDVLGKRCKIMRLLNWIRVLRANPPNLATFQQIGDYCGVSRQAAKKDADEIFEFYPQLISAKAEKHSRTNRSNRKIE